VFGFGFGFAGQEEELHGVAGGAAAAVDFLGSFRNAQFRLAGLVVAPAGAFPEVPPADRPVHHFHDVFKVAFDVSDDVGGVVVGGDGPDVGS
jgi:hypothetical protein